MSRCISLSFVLILTAVLAAPSPALGAADAGTLDAARADLAHLEGLLRKRRSTHDDLIAYVEIVRDAHIKAEGDARSVEALRRDIEARLLRALSVTRAKQDKNQLEGVNVAAAEALTVIGPTVDVKTRKALAKRIRKAILALHDARRYEPTSAVINATFAAFARVGDLDTLRWLLEEYSHTKSVEGAFLMGAHQAMVLFEDVPGKLRFQIVKRFQQRYAGVESQAEQSSNDPAVASAKRFWDRIRVPTIAVLQTFARFPENEKGEALSTVGEFQSWFRGHKNARKAPWTDGAAMK